MSYRSQAKVDPDPPATRRERRYRTRVYQHSPVPVLVVVVVACLASGWLALAAHGTAELSCERTSTSRPPTCTLRWARGWREHTRSPVDPLEVLDDAASSSGAFSCAERSVPPKAALPRISPNQRKLLADRLADHVAETQERPARSTFVEQWDAWDHPTWLLALLLLVVIVAAGRQWAEQSRIDLDLDTMVVRVRTSALLGQAQEQSHDCSWARVAEAVAVPELRGQFHLVISDGADQRLELCYARERDAQRAAAAMTTALRAEQKRRGARGMSSRPSAG